MSSARLTDGRVLHFPGGPAITDSFGMIQISVSAEAEAVSLVPLIERDELLLFAQRLVAGTRKRRREARYREVNPARLRIAKACLDRALIEIFGAEAMIRT